jgi:phospholipid transport system substrate-binding protein
MRTLSAAALAILLLMQPVSATAGPPGDQLRQSTDKILEILKDPRFKGESKENERREKLREVLYQRFDFTEMAKRSLGAEWRRHTPEETKRIRYTFYQSPRGRLFG